MSRRTKTLLLTAPALLKPELVDIKHTQRDIKRGQAKQAEYTDKTAHKLPILLEGDTVRLQPFKIGEKTWAKGTVIKRLDERSYHVETPSGVLRRNRQHLKRTAEPNTKKEININTGTNNTEIPATAPAALCVDQTTSTTKTAVSETTVVLSEPTPEPELPELMKPSTPVKTTRRGRPVNKPLRYQRDFVSQAGDTPGQNNPCVTLRGCPGSLPGPHLFLSHKYTNKTTHKN